MRLIFTMLRFVVFFLALACAGSKTTQSTGEMVDSASITTRVKTKLLTDKQVDGLGINVDTYKSQVMLSGFVNSRSERDRAGLLASQVDGVSEVVNNLEVKGE